MYERRSGSHRRDGEVITQNPSRFLESRPGSDTGLRGGSADEIVGARLATVAWVLSHDGLKSTWGAF